MTGTTPNGIRYPDGASKAKNLGAELQQMAEDIDTFIDNEISGESANFQAAVNVAVTAANIPAKVDTAVAAEIIENDLVRGLDPRVSVLTDHPDYAFAIVDEFDRLSDLSIGHDGSFSPHVISGLARRVGSTMEAMTRSKLSHIVAWGESTTFGGGGASYPGYLAELLPGVTVTNRGVNGRTSGTIAAAQGGNALVVNGFTMPATTAPVAVTVTAQITPANMANAGMSFDGLIGGIRARLYYEGGQWYIAREVAGAATVIPQSRFNPDTIWTERDNVMLIWLGINDAASTPTTAVQGVVAAIDSMLRYASPGIVRFLILTTLTRTDTPAGNGYYNRVKAINDALVARWPQNVIDVRRHIIDHSLSILGITPTAADLAAIAADTLPPSAMYDATHPSGPCYRDVVAPFVRDALESKGWTL